MRRDIPQLEFSDAEASLAKLLAEPCTHADAQRACDVLARILGDVLGSLDREHEWKRWDPDDLVCRSIERNEEVVSLHGGVHWLTGGANGSRFRVDLALDTLPLLYSFKLLEQRRGRQVLYGGKTPAGWTIGDG